MANIALKSEDLTMYFKDFGFIKASFLELFINIGSEDEVVAFEMGIRPILQDVKSFVWLNISVSHVSVAVKVPKLLRICFEEGRICCILEAHACLFEVWVAFVEAIGTSEVRKA